MTRVCRAGLSTGPPAPATGGESGSVTRKLTEEKDDISFAEVIGTLKQYAWPDGRPDIKLRVVSGASGKWQLTPERSQCAARLGCD